MHLGGRFVEVGGLLHGLLRALSLQLLLALLGLVLLLLVVRRALASLASGALPSRPAGGAAPSRPAAGAPVSPGAVLAAGRSSSGLLLLVGADARAEGRGLEGPARRGGDGDGVQEEVVEPLEHDGGGGARAQGRQGALVRPGHAVDVDDGEADAREVRVRVRGRGLEGRQTRLHLAQTPRRRPPGRPLAVQLQERFALALLLALQTRRGRTPFLSQMSIYCYFHILVFASTFRSVFTTYLYLSISILTLH